MKKVGPGSDIWSLGCLMYLLLFFKHPFNNNPEIFKDGSEMSKICNRVNNRFM